MTGRRQLWLGTGEQSNGLHQQRRCENAVYSKDGFREWDAICNYGSYGSELDLLEISGVLVSDGVVEGYLTAHQVAEKYKAWKGVKHV